MDVEDGGQISSWEILAQATVYSPPHKRIAYCEPAQTCVYSKGKDALL